MRASNDIQASQASYQIIADLLRAHTGQHLTESRRWRVATALSGVFREHGISNIDQLVCLLDQRVRAPGRPDLSQQVVEALLNNETYFFRDKPTFDQLPEDVLPALAERRSATKRLSVWCAGCSTGQEVHSIAMMFADMRERWEGWTIELLGTDVSHRAINAARNGVYSQFEVQRGLSVVQMLRHFEETSQGWQVREDTLGMSRFQHHNILDAPPSHQKFDLVLCRNVLLYFDQATRERAFERLHGSLADDGFLMLGAGETVVGQTRAFTPSPKRASLYEITRKPTENTLVAANS